MAVAIVNSVVRVLGGGNAKVFIGKSVISGGDKTEEIGIPMNTAHILLPITSDSAQKGIAITEDFPLVKTAATIRNESNDATTYWLVIGR